MYFSKTLSSTFSSPSDNLADAVVVKEVWEGLIYLSVKSPVDSLLNWTGKSSTGSHPYNINNHLIIIIVTIRNCVDDVVVSLEISVI